MWFVGLGVHPRIPAFTLCGAVLLLTLATRWPLMQEHLFSFDSVNLALSLREFDPAHHQPQPPGYPLFVAEARMVYWLAGTPERTFTVLKILISSLCVILLFVLARRMFSKWMGVAAAGLFFCNPVFWYAGLTSSLRPHLALVTMIVAYCCWRAGSGEHRFFYAASLALGLGSGFRPELCFFLLPLWLWTAWQCHGKRFVLANALLLLVGTGSWIVALIIAYGGLAQMLSSFHVYLLEQSQSVMAAVGGPGVEWRRMVGRAFLWNGLGVLPWVWTVPLAWHYRNRMAHWNRQLIFLALWFIPPFVFHLLVHIGDSGHALATIPALCLAGGLCTIEAQAALATKQAANSHPIGPVIWLALLGNVALFFWPYPVPQRKEVSEFRGWASLQDAVLVGTYETSYARVRYIGRTTKMALRQIEDLKAAADRPVVLLWNRDAVPVWRKVAYYRPSERVYELTGRRTARPRARLWRGKRMLSDVSGPPSVKLPVPKQGRLIWLVHPDVVTDLSRAVRLRGAFPAYYTDLDEDSPQFHWGSFEFVPE